MLDYYQRRAAEYDAIYHKPERQADLRRIEQWLPTVFAGRDVLEIACGTGYWTRFIAATARTVHATDLAAAPLAIARQRVDSRHVSFAVRDAHETAPVWPRVDAAFAGFWWSHVPRQSLQAFLDALHGSLRPGAPVVFLDNRYVAGSSTSLSHTDEAGNTWQRRHLADGSEHQVMKNFPDEDELRRCLAGRAAAVTYRCWDHYWAVAYDTRE
jgi:SAM-dependent methyltransferase